MKLVATRKQDQNRAAVDPWTAVHMAAGLAMGLMNIPLRHAVTASVAYEVAEQFVERYQWGQDLFETHGPETLPNAVVDTAVLVLGHHLGRLWNQRT